MPSLLKWVDKESIPEYLGGTSKHTLLDDAGPWQDPRLVSEIEADLAKIHRKKDIREEPELEESISEGANNGPWCLLVDHARQTALQEKPCLF